MRALARTGWKFISFTLSSETIVVPCTPAGVANGDFHEGVLDVLPSTNNRRPNISLRAQTMRDQTLASSSYERSRGLAYLEVRVLLRHVQVLARLYSTFHLVSMSWPTAQKGVPKQ